MLIKKEHFRPIAPFVLALAVILIGHIIVQYASLALLYTALFLAISVGMFYTFQDLYKKRERYSAWEAWFGQTLFAGMTLITLFLAIVCFLSGVLKLF